MLSRWLAIMNGIGRNDMIEQEWVIFWGGLLFLIGMLIGFMIGGGTSGSRSNGSTNPPTLRQASPPPPRKK